MHIVLMDIQNRKWDGTVCNRKGTIIDEKYLKLKQRSTNGCPCNNYISSKRRYVFQISIIS